MGGKGKRENGTKRAKLHTTPMGPERWDDTLLSQRNVARLTRNPGLVLCIKRYELIEGRKEEVDGVTLRLAAHFTAQPR